MSQPDKHGIFFDTFIMLRFSHLSILSAGPCKAGTWGLFLAHHVAFPEKEGRTLCGRYPWANWTHAPARAGLTLSGVSYRVSSLKPYHRTRCSPQSARTWDWPWAHHRITIAFRPRLIASVYPGPPVRNGVGPRRSIDRTLFPRRNHQAPLKRPWVIASPMDGSRSR